MARDVDTNRYVQASFAEEIRQSFRAHSRTRRKYYGQVVDGGSFPTGLEDKFVLVQPGEFSGTEGEGNDITFTPDPDASPVPVAVLGTMPSIGELVRARNIEGIWVWDRGDSTAGPCGSICWHVTLDCYYERGYTGDVTVTIDGPDGYHHSEALTPIVVSGAFGGFVYHFAYVDVCISDLDPGDYTLTATIANYNTKTDVVTFTEDCPYISRTLRMYPTTYSVCITVKGCNLLSLEGATVSVYIREDGTLLGSGITDSTGVACFDVTLPSDRNRDGGRGDILEGTGVPGSTGFKIGSTHPQEGFIETVINDYTSLPCTAGRFGSTAYIIQQIDIENYVCCLCVFPFSRNQVFADDYGTCDLEWMDAPWNGWVGGYCFQCDYTLTLNGCQYGQGMRFGTGNACVIVVAKCGLDESGNLTVSVKKYFYLQQLSGVCLSESDPLPDPRWFFYIRADYVPTSISDTTHMKYVSGPAGSSDCSNAPALIANGQFTTFCCQDLGAEAANGVPCTLGFWSVG